MYDRCSILRLVEGYICSEVIAALKRKRQASVQGFEDGGE
jgi:hypothetical protein